MPNLIYKNLVGADGRGALGVGEDGALVIGADGRRADSGGAPGVTGALLTCPVGGTGTLVRRALGGSVRAYQVGFCALGFRFAQNSCPAGFTSFFASWNRKAGDDIRFEAAGSVLHETPGEVSHLKAGQRPCISCFFTTRMWDSTAALEATVLDSSWLQRSASGMTEVSKYCTRRGQWTGHT